MRSLLGVTKDLADSPDIKPFWVSDFSKSEVNLLTSSGFKAGTLTGPPAGAGGGLAVAGRGGGPSVRPSNQGSGPAAMSQYLPSTSKHTAEHVRCRANSSVGGRPA